MRAKSVLNRIIRSDLMVITAAVLITSFVLSQISTGFTSNYNLSSLAVDNCRHDAGGFRPDVRSLDWPF